MIHRIMRVAGFSRIQAKSESRDSLNLNIKITLVCLLNQGFFIAVDLNNTIVDSGKF